MTINGKMIRNIIIAVVVLGLLGGAYFWAVKWQPDDEADDGMSAETIEVFSLEPDRISAIDFKNENNEFSMKRIGEGDNATWSIPKYPDIEFSQTKLQSAVSGFVGIFAVKEIGASLDNLEEFGLASENNTVTIHGDDGTECTLILGNSVMVDDTYYLMKKGENKVYTVSAYTAASIMKVPNDFRETNLGSIDAASIQEFSVAKNGSRVMEFKKSLTSEELTEIDMSDIVMTYPYAEKIRSDEFEEMVTAYTTTIEVIEFISDDLSQKAEYGLDKGYKVVLRDAENMHTLTFGDIAEDGSVYAMYNDNKFIFTMSSALLDAVKDIKPFDLVQKFAHIYNINEVKSIEVSKNGKTNTLTIEKTDNEEMNCSIDGKKADEEAFKEVYQAIIGLSFTDVVQDKAKASDVICEITFTMNDGKVNKAVYRAYDERRVMVTRPDGKEYLMLEKYVTDMMNKVEKLSKNPNPKK